MSRVVPLLTTALLAAGGRASAAGPQRHHHIDEREIRQLEANTPDALSLLMQGEAALRDGDAKRAAESFEAAWKLSPRTSLIGRRYCQALTELGKRTQAMAVCEATMGLSGAPQNTTAFVRATMAGPEAPTSKEVEEALYFALLAKRRMKWEPWGYAAECDIAARVGDEASQRSCVEELERVAPGHYEARRARALLPKPESSGGLLAGWIAFGVAGLGTLGHALWNTARRRRHAAAGVLVLAGIGLVAPEARAGDPKADLPTVTRYQIDDGNPLASVPTPEQRDADPVEFGNYLMEITGRARESEIKGDRQRAIRYYTAAAKAVPDRAVTFSKLCALYEAEGMVPAALQACRAALILPGVALPDYERFGRLVLNSKATLGADDRAYLKEMIAHLRKMSDREIQVAEQLECPLAVRAEDEAWIASCVERLSKLYPKGHKDLYAYQWSLAMTRGDFGKAYEALDRLRSLPKANPASVAKMEQATSEAQCARWGALFWNWRVGAGALALLIAGIGVAVGLRIRSLSARRARGSV